MILSQVKINKFSRHRTKATWVGLSLVTTVLLLDSQFPSSRAMACLPGLDNTGLVCKTVTQVTSLAPFSADARFLALNLLTAGAMMWKGYQIWLAPRVKEKKTVNSINSVYQKP